LTQRQSAARVLTAKTSVCVVVMTARILQNMARQQQLEAVVEPPKLVASN